MCIIMFHVVWSSVNIAHLACFNQVIIAEHVSIVFTLNYSPYSVHHKLKYAINLPLCINLLCALTNTYLCVNVKLGNCALNRVVAGHQATLISLCKCENLTELHTNVTTVNVDCGMRGSLTFATSIDINMQDGRYHRE